MLIGEERNRLSWLHLEKEGNCILRFQWALDYVPGSHGDNIPTAELASWTDKPQIPYQDFPLPKRMQWSPVWSVTFVIFRAPRGVGHSVETADSSDYASWL